MREKGMSQLDYLWVNFGNYSVQDQVSSIPQDNVLLSEKAITQLIQGATEGGISSLTYREHPSKEDTMQLIGSSINGTELTIVEMPKEIHVSGFTHRKVTQVDIDNGCQFPIDSPVISLTLTNGIEYLLSLNELGLNLQGNSTNTVVTEINNGIISANLKINTAQNTLNGVELLSNSAGIYGRLLLNTEETGINLTLEEGKLTAKLPLKNTEYNLNFQQLTLSEYQLLQSKSPSTVYIISDKPYIYIGTQRYGIDMQPGEVPIVSLVYDADHMLLSYKKSDGSDIQQIHLGPATSTVPGMISTDTYNDIVKLKEALDDIVSIKDYVTTEVNKAGFSLELGESSNGYKPLNLKDNTGKTISTVNIDVENFVEFGTSKVADLQDVVDSENKVIEGHYILILTLTSGEKIYIDLNELVDSYTALNTHSINLDISDQNVISANLNINSSDKILTITNNGLTAQLQVVRDVGKVIFYGKSRTEPDKIGEITLGDAVKKFTFITSADENTQVQYPPRQIDGKDYSQTTNPVVIGSSYFIIVFGEDTGDVSTSYEYCDYINVDTILNTIKLSPNDGNLLSKDNNGLLYASLKWIKL